VSRQLSPKQFQHFLHLIARPKQLAGLTSIHSFGRHALWSSSETSKHSFKFSSMNCTCATLCAADRPMRSLLLPSGTVGCRIAGKWKPRAHIICDTATALLADPTMTGQIGALHSCLMAVWTSFCNRARCARRHCSLRNCRAFSAET
jgi:hypothetical protein